MSDEAQDFSATANVKAMQYTEINWRSIKKFAGEILHKKHSHAYVDLEKGRAFIVPTDWLVCFPSSKMGENPRWDVVKDKAFQDRFSKTAKRKKK